MFSMTRRYKSVCHLGAPHILTSSNIASLPEKQEYLCHLKDEEKLNASAGKQNIIEQSIKRFEKWLVQGEQVPGKQLKSVNAS